jgi:hypothetical protein
MSQGLVTVTSTAVTATAVKIANLNHSQNAVFIRNRTASAGAVFIGPQGVTAATGFEIPAGQTIGPIPAQAELFAVATTTATVNVLATTVAPL